MSEQPTADAEATLWRAMFVSLIHVLNRVDADVKASADLTLLDLGVLFAITHADDGRPMGQVAAVFGVDPSVITYRVKRLEGQGLVVRSPAAADRRVTHVRCTTAGRRRLRRARALMLESAHEHFFAHVDAADVPMLTTTFEGLLDEQARTRRP